MQEIASIRPLLPAVAEAGELAQRYYRRPEALGVRLKADHTVVTEADGAVETLLRRAISDMFPGVNILGEEGETDYDPTCSYTFVIDPIDGTAAFATATPAWAICIGVLNQALQPLAGIVSAPGWDSLFVADIDPETPATHNESPLAVVTRPDRVHVDRNTTILIDSKLPQTHYMHNFPGKCRSFGSTALHVCLVAQNTGYELAHACSAYAWDIVAAHAIAARVGLRVQYLDGRALMYEALIPNMAARSHIVAGHPTILATMCPRILPLPPLRLAAD